MANSRLQIEVEVDSSGALKGFRMVEDAIKKTSASAEKIGDTRFDKFADGVGRFVQQPLESAGNAVTGMLRTMGPLGAGLGAAAGAIGALGATGISAARDLGRLGDEIEDTAIRMGLTTREVGEFRFAMKYAGGDMASLEGMMRKLSQGLSESGSEGKKAKEALAELGINARTSGGELRPMGEVILELGAALRRIEDPMTRNALAIQALGRSALEVLPDLMELEEGIARAKALGLAPTDAEIKQWKVYHQQIAEADALWEKLKRQLKEPLAGAVVITLKYLTQPTPTRNIYQGSGYGELDPAMIAQNAAARRLVNPSATALFGADFQRISGTNTRNQAEIDRLRARFGVSKSGIEEAYRQAAKDAAEARDKLFAGDISQRDTYLSKTAEANRLKSQLDAMAKAEAARAKIKRPSLDDFSAATSEVARRSATAQASKMAEEAIAAIERDGRISDAIRDEFLKGIDAAAYMPRATAGPPGASIEQRRAAIQAAASAQERILELTAGPGGEVRAVQEIAALRAGLAERERSLAVEKANSIADEFERNRALYDAQFDYEQELFAVQQDRVQRILELRKRGEEEYVATTKRAFEALISGGRSGLESFLKSQVTGIGSTIVGNIARMTYSPGRFSLPGVGTADNPTVLGKILQGTPFGTRPEELAAGKQVTAATLQMRAATTFAAAVTGFAAGAALPGGAGLPMASMPFGGVLGTLLGPGGTSGFAGPLGSMGGGGRIPTGFGAFSSGFGSVLGGGNIFKAITGGDYSIQLGPGNTTTASALGLTSTAGRVGVAAGTAAAVGSGVLATYQGFKRGNIAAGIGGALGTAAALDPEPISKGILASAAFVATLIGMADPKGKRAEAIDRMLEGARYESPESMTYQMDTSGRGFDYDFRGGARVVNITNNISAIDSRSFAETVRANGSAIAETLDDQLMTHGPLQQRVRATALPV